VALVLDAAGRYLMNSGTAAVHATPAPMPAASQ
jgi:hypothetical protein